MSRDSADVESNHGTGGQRVARTYNGLILAELMDWGGGGVRRRETNREGPGLEWITTANVSPTQYAGGPAAVLSAGNHLNTHSTTNSCGCSTAGYNHFIYKAVTWTTLHTQLLFR